MALTPRQDRMNRALDGQLTDAELEQLYAHLDSDPREAVVYEQLRQVDKMLRNPPMAAAPVNFAANVMTAIQAGKHEVYFRPARSFLWFGLLLGVIVATPLVILGLMALGQALQDPAILTTLFQSLEQTLGALSNFSAGVLSFLGDLFHTYPVIPALLLTLIPVALLWGWLVWFLQQRNRPPTITIQVQMAHVRSAT